MITDTFGGVVKIVRSTIVSYPAVWLFTKHGEHSKYKGAVHLTVDQAKQLRDELDDFIGRHGG